jgi:hypothetical protein
MPQLRVTGFPLLKMSGSRNDDNDNHANQLNPNNDEYAGSRDMSEDDDYDDDDTPGSHAIPVLSRLARRVFLSIRQLPPALMFTLVSQIRPNMAMATRRKRSCGGFRL